MKLFPDEKDQIQIKIQLDFLFNSVFRISPYTQSFLKTFVKDDRYYLHKNNSKSFRFNKEFNEDQIEELLIRILPSLGDSKLRDEYARRLSDDTNSTTIAKALAKIISNSKIQSEFEYFSPLRNGYIWNHSNKSLMYLFALISITFHKGNDTIQDYIRKINSKKCLLLDRQRNLKWDNLKQQFYNFINDQDHFITYWNSIIQVDGDKLITKDNKKPHFRKDPTNPFKHYGTYPIDPYQACNELIYILKKCNINL